MDRRPFDRLIGLFSHRLGKSQNLTPSGRVRPLVNLPVEVASCPGARPIAHRRWPQQVAEEMQNRLLPAVVARAARSAAAPMCLPRKPRGRRGNLSAASSTRLAFRIEGVSGIICPGLA